MKKTIILSMILISAIAIGLLLENPSYEQTYDLEETSGLNMTYKGYDISEFYVPDIIEPEMSCSLLRPLDDRVRDISGMHFLAKNEWEGPERTYRFLLNCFGEALFHDFSLSRGSRCADCHNDSGTGFEFKARGGGRTVQKVGMLYYTVFGYKPNIEDDFKRERKNASNLNSWRNHRNGIILSGAVRGRHVLEQQVDSATFAHFIEDLFIKVRDREDYQRASILLFGEKISRKTLACGISAFQQMSTGTSRNKMNMIMRNPGKYEIQNQRGFVLFMDKNCNSCHMNGRISKSRITNDSFPARGLDLNLVDHKSYMTTGEPISFGKAVMICDRALVEDLKDPQFSDISNPKWGDKLSWRDRRQVVAFMTECLTDPRYRS